MRSASANDPALRSPGPEDATPRPVAGPYFAGLEGLRAVAASLVVVHHAASLVGPSVPDLVETPAAVMDMGVAVFFVLSGFLIYRPFVAAHLQGRPALGTGTFWYRRLVRIVPAYWAALSILWAFGVFHLGSQWWRYYLFLQIYDPFTTLGGIVPAWSLNTEISFYLVVPLVAVVLGAVGRRTGRPAVVQAVGLGAMVLGGYVSRWWFSGNERVWVAFPGQPPVTMREVSFSWLPNNLDLFGWGMLLALVSVWAAPGTPVRARLERVARPAGVWFAAAAVVFAWFAWRIGPPQFNGGYRGGYWQLRQATFGLISLCLLVPVVLGPPDGTGARRALTWRPVAWMGLVSYGLYLWHQDLLEQIPAWLDRPPWEVPFLVALVGAFVLGTAAAAVSWYALEQPVQRVARRHGPSGTARAGR